MRDFQFDISDMVELATPVGLHGAVHQVEVAGDTVFSIIIGVVLSGSSIDPND